MTLYDKIISHLVHPECEIFGTSGSEMCNFSKKITFECEKKNLLTLGSPVVQSVQQSAPEPKTTKMNRHTDTI